MNPLADPKWLEILREVYGVKTYQLGDVCGYVCRNRFYSLKFSPVLNKYQLKDIEDFCDKKRYSYLLTSGFNDLGAGGIVKKTIVMELQDGMKANRNARNMLTKSEHLGVSASETYLTDFYRLYSKHGKGHKHPFKFFKLIFEKLPAVLIAVWLESELIGAGVTLLGETAAYIYMASTKLENAPNQRMMWEIIKMCLEKKIYLLDIGESGYRSGTYDFKINFGGIPRDVFYYRKDVSLTFKFLREKRII